MSDMYEIGGQWDMAVAATDHLYWTHPLSEVKHRE